MERVTKNSKNYFHSFPRASLDFLGLFARKEPTRKNKKNLPLSFVSSFHGGDGNHSVDNTLLLNKDRGIVRAFSMPLLDFFSCETNKINAKKNWFLFFPHQFSCEQARKTPSSSSTNMIYCSLSGFQIPFPPTNHPYISHD